MDIIQIFPYKSEQFISFGLKRSRENDLYCAVTRTKAHILELIYNHHCDEKLSVEQSVLTDLTTFMPSHGIPKNASSIFNKSTKSEQNQILLDYHLMSEELKITNERIALINITWSPMIKNLPGNHYLAYLTNFGGCEIRRKHTGKRAWSIIVHNIAKEWMLQCQKTLKHTITTYQGLEDAIFNMQITAICWNNIKFENSKFSMITADGTLAFFDVGHELHFLYQKQIDSLKKVQAMEWFSFYDRHNCLRSYVITCELTGLVKLFGVHMNGDEILDVCKTIEIFSEVDGIPANGIQWEYHKNDEIEQLLVVFVKTMHIFVYLINYENGELISSLPHYIGHSTINGKFCFLRLN